MQWFNIFRQHFKFISHQGKTVLLIVLHPFLVGLILYPLLTSLDHPNIHVSAFVSDPQFSSLLDSINSVGTARVLASPDAVKHAVLEGSADVGLVVISDKKGPHVIVYGSPFRPYAASLLRLYVQTNLISFAGQAVSQVGQKVTQLSDMLSQVQNNLDYMRSSVRDAESAVSQIQGNLPDISPFYDYVNQMAEFEGKIDEYVQDIDDYRARLDMYIAELRDIEDKLTYAKKRQDEALSALRSERDDVDASLSRLDSAISYLDSALSLLDPDSDAYNDVYNAREQLYEVRDTLQSLRSAIDEAISYTQETPLDEYLAKVHSARVDLERTRSQLGAMKSELLETKKQVHNSRIQLSRQLDDISAEVDDANRQMTLLLSALHDAGNRLDQIIPLLSFSLGSGPKLPYLEYRDVVHLPSSGSTYYPFVVALDILMVALLLPVIMRHREKDQGIEVRLKAMHVSPFAITLGRYLAYVIIVFLQSLLVLLAGVAMGFIPQAYAAHGIIAVFVATLFLTTLGILFAVSASNVVLGFMVVVLFEVIFVLISGRVVPTELMAGGMRTISANSPLALVSSLMEGAMLSGYLSGHLLTLLSVFSIFLFFTAVAVQGRVSPE